MGQGPVGIWVQDRGSALPTMGPRPRPRNPDTGAGGRTPLATLLAGPVPLCCPGVAIHVCQSWCPVVVPEYMYFNSCSFDWQPRRHCVWASAVSYVLHTLRLPDSAEYTQRP